MAAHAKYSASGSPTWMNCSASVSAQDGLPDQSSSYAREGTAAHQVFEWCGVENKDAEAFQHRMIHVEGETFEVDLDMARHINWSHQQVNEIIPDGALVNYEQTVNYSDAIGYENSFGTADVIAIHGSEIIVADLKYGRGIEVNAKDNSQLMLYALGAMALYDVLGPFTTIRLVIIQPRLNHVSEHVINAAELELFRERAAQAVQDTVNFPDRYTPGEAQCRWCKAKGTCPGLKQKVLQEFDALPDPSIKEVDDNALAHAMQYTELAEMWAKAVRAEVERRLLAGHAVNGYKLVEGRRGHRKWVDAKVVEDALKQMRVKNDEMYEFKLITPTTAEKLAKAGKLGPRQWSTLSQHITQSEGKPSVAKADDSRPPVQRTMEFDNIA
jgi:hypothetical protein